MSNLNSHDSNHSSSSDSQELEVRQEQRALALLPTAYPLELTKEYQTAFGSDALVPLPASYRLAYWRKHIGDPHWQRVQEEAAEYNRKANEEYAKKVAVIEAKNARIEERNEQSLAVYRRLEDEYPQRYAQWEQDLKRHQQKLKRKSLEEARNNLEAVLNRQDEAIRKAVDQVIEATLKGILLRGLTEQVAKNLWLYINSQDDDFWGARWLEIAGRTKRYKFLPSGEGIKDCGDHYRVRFPLCFPDATPGEEKRLGHLWHPFGANFSKEDFPSHDVQGKIADVLLGRQKDTCRAFVNATLFGLKGKETRRLHYMELLDEQLKKQKVIDYLMKLHPLSKRSPPKPEPPREPRLASQLQLPTPPALKIPTPLIPPSYCFDCPENDNIEHVFKGSQVYGIEQVTTLARTHLFAEGQVRPYFVFGGVPFTISGGSPHMLIVGTSGSGKTTALLRLMSSLLPLSRAQAERLAERLSSGNAPYPESSHQWGRSLTHQAVVYNAKGEYLKYLEAFGFDSNVDLFNLDPADPNGYAWDVAADINDRESIQKFAEQLIPMNASASQDESHEFWMGTARNVIDALILSFRNAARHAGKEPSWTLRDLVTATASENSIKHVLRWHDTPVQKLEQIFGLAESQQSSVRVSLQKFQRDFGLVANRWYDAGKRGRAISLKKWSLAGARSVLVLPNTKANVSAYGPLNKSLFKALTDLWLKEENAFYIDDKGKQRTHHRYVFIDEFGQAGQLDELDRLMGEGRYFGVNVVLGLHQLSQIRETYGENVSETIIGLCSYLACLKSNDQRTQKWMSEQVGTCLRSYEKVSFSYSTSQGQTLTKSSSTTHGQSSGTNESQNKGSTKGTSDTTGSSTSHTDSKQQSSTSSSGPGQRGTSTRGTTEADGHTTSKSHTDNESTTEGTTTGTSRQINSSHSDGTSNALNTTENKGESKTRELRGEAAIEPHEFRTFPDPEKTGACEGVYLAPTLPVWRTRLTIDQMQPEYAFPEKLNQPSVRRTAEADELVSRSHEWTGQDLERLYLDKPHTLPVLPKMLMLPENTPREKQQRGRAVEQQSSLVVPEEPDDHEPPLADFNY
ncbi:MAG: type IV secretion system DNA-binding domain-containing protein [Pirellulales bacterium]|nr:type IV secretion system DNA-binding domain-containing protein [Pirellulales bacterium]